jgi:hypothetical protein
MKCNFGIGKLGNFLRPILHYSLSKENIEVEQIQLKKISIRRWRTKISKS